MSFLPSVGTTFAPASSVPSGSPTSASCSSGFPTTRPSPRMTRYLHEVLQFPTQQAGALSGFFGGLVWFLPVFGGTLADKMGFRKALALAYLISVVRLFPAGIAGVAVAGAGAADRAAGRTGGDRAGAARLRSGAGQADRGGHHGALVARRRPLLRLLHLLHAGEHRRRAGPVRGLLRTPADERRERVSRGRAQRVRDVHRRADLLQEPNRDRDTQTPSMAQAGRNFLHRAVEPALHAVPRRSSPATGSCTGRSS